MNKITMSISLFATIAITLFSCKRPSPVVPHAHEEIAKVEVSFIALDSLTSDTFQVTFDESGTPIPNSLNLNSGKSYKISINPKDGDGHSFQEEIIEEGDEHQFFFFATPKEGIANYTYLDKDKDNRGIGLNGEMVISSTDFELNIKLRHGLDKSHTGASTYNNTDYASAGGEDDLNLYLPIIVE